MLLSLVPLELADTVLAFHFSVFSLRSHFCYIFHLYGNLCTFYGFITCNYVEPVCVSCHRVSGLRRWGLWLRRRVEVWGDPFVLCVFLVVACL